VITDGSVTPSREGTRSLVRHISTNLWRDNMRQLRLVRSLHAPRVITNLVGERRVAGRRQVTAADVDRRLPLSLRPRVVNFDSYVRVVKTPDSHVPRHY
jgi:hypothetical protein